MYLSLVRSRHWQAYPIESLSHYTSAIPNSPIRLRARTVSGSPWVTTALKVRREPWNSTLRGTSQSCAEIDGWFTVVGSRRYWPVAIFRTAARRATTSPVAQGNVPQTRIGGLSDPAHIWHTKVMPKDRIRSDFWNECH